MDILTDTATHLIAPEDAWKRLKTRSRKPRYRECPCVGCLARGHGTEQRRAAKPRAERRTRSKSPPTPLNPQTSLWGSGRSSAIVSVTTGTRTDLCAGVQAMRNDEFPEPPAEGPDKSDNGPSIELLKVLLKLKCDSHKVAQKLIASSNDIEAIAATTTRMWAPCRAGDTTSSERMHSS